MANIIQSTTSQPRRRSADPPPEERTSPASATDEIDSFKDLWRGGYFEGDPLDPFGASGYGLLGYLSALYVTYRICIRPYVNGSTRALEIGPGRGAWTRCMLSAEEVWCLDALPADHNGFWKYLDNPRNVKYFQVTDFRCEMLPGEYFDFFFSFGCFCHISPAAFEEYMTSLFPKMKRGAHGFVMIADYDKYNRALASLGSTGIQLVPRGRRFLPLRLVEAATNKLVSPGPRFRDKNEDMVPRAGRWYHLDTSEACATLERLGFRVVEPDVEVNPRDPIIHFAKP
jgi:hypothetical protein